MPNLDPIYTGAAGDASALFRPAGLPPNYSTSKGTAGHFLASPEQTGGAFSLYRWDMSPTSGGPGPHFHRTYAETFYVLSGSVRLYDGTCWRDGEPGDALYVPPGGIHAFTNVSGAPASMLMLITPGADRGAYFNELADIAASGRVLSDDEWAELHARHDNVMLED